MKRSGVAMVAFVIAAVMPCRAAENDFWSGQVMVDVRAIALPMPIAVEMMPKLTAKSPGTGVFDELDGLVLANKAELLDATVILASPGTTAKTETGEDIRLPVEPDPPMGHPTEVPSDNGFSTTFYDPFVHPWYGFPRTSFGEQSTGFAVDLELKLNPEPSQIDITINVGLTRFAGLQEFSKVKSPLRIVGAIDQANFDTHRVTTQLVVPSGEAQLLSSFIDKQQRVVLFVIRVTRIPLQP